MSNGPRVYVFGPFLHATRRAVQSPLLADVTRPNRNYPHHNRPRDVTDPRHKGSSVESTRSSKTTTSIKPTASSPTGHVAQVTPTDHTTIMDHTTPTGHVMTPTYIPTIPTDHVISTEVATPPADHKTTTIGDINHPKLTISVESFNCHGFKESCDFILSRLVYTDFMCLSETWTKPSELHLIQNIINEHSVSKNNTYIVFSKSGMTEDDEHTPR